MHIDEMRYIEDVIVDQLIIAGDRNHVGLGASPIWMISPPPIRDQRRIGAFRLTHPDPNPIEALDERIGPDRGIRWDLSLAWDLDTTAARIEAQPVVAAAQRIAFEPTEGKRQVAVATAILERDRLAVLLPVEDDRLAKDYPPSRLPAELAVPGRHIPGIAQKH